MQVKLFCNDPKFLTYWAGLANTLVKNLKLSDGSPPPTVEPWTLIPDKNNDRTILKLWIEGWDAKKIGRELDGSHRTVYDRLRLLRKEYGEDIVPKHRKP
jgi:DNA-binding NarL/FixJ family response regulator